MTPPWDDPTVQLRCAQAAVNRMAFSLAHEVATTRRHGGGADAGMALSSGQLAQIYGFTDVDGRQPDAWRYLVEVQDAGKTADVTGYGNQHRCPLLQSEPWP